MTELELKIYKIVRSIPEGKVATYGQIAKLAGDVHLARFVGNVMHKNPLPFWKLAKSVGYKDYAKFEAREASTDSKAGSDGGKPASFGASKTTSTDQKASSATSKTTSTKGKTFSSSGKTTSSASAASFQLKNFEPVPCHRVVNSSGKMGANFGMGGPEIQKKMLESEGVKFKNGKVDFSDDKILFKEYSPKIF